MARLGGSAVESFIWNCPAPDTLATYQDTLGLHPFNLHDYNWRRLLAMHCKRLRLSRVSADLRACEYVYRKAEACPYTETCHQTSQDFLNRVNIAIS